MKKYVAVLVFIISLGVLTAEANEDFCDTLAETARDYAALSTDERRIVRQRAEDTWRATAFGSVEQDRWSWITLVMDKADEGRPFGVRGTITACIQEQEQ